MALIDSLNKIYGLQGEGETGAVMPSVPMPMQATHTMPDGTSMPGSDHAAYQDMMMSSGATSNQEMQLMQEMQGMSEEDKSRLQHLL